MRKDVLEAQINDIYKRTKQKFSLDYAACYGGYCLEDADGKYRLSVRMSAAHMHSFLRGMQTMLDIQQKLMGGNMRW